MLFFIYRAEEDEEIARRVTEELLNEDEAHKKQREIEDEVTKMKLFDEVISFSYHMNRSQMEDVKREG